MVPNFMVSMVSINCNFKIVASYMLVELIVTNSIYYGISFILYVTGVWQPILIGIALLFGIGNAFDTIVSLGAYWYLLRRHHINILDVEKSEVKEAILEE